MPTLHLGQKAHQQEQRGIQIIRRDYNRKIEAYNKELEDVKKQLESEKYKQEIERVKVEQQEKERQAGQGKEREEQPLSYIDRYRQATERRLVRDPQRQNRSYRKPADRYREAMEKRQDRGKNGRDEPVPHHQPEPRSYEDRYQQPDKEKPSTLADRYREAMERRRRERERDNDHERQKRQTDRKQDHDRER